MAIALQIDPKLQLLSAHHCLKEAEVEAHHCGSRSSGDFRSKLCEG